jgi:hypothetical protein
MIALPLGSRGEFGEQEQRTQFPTQSRVVLAHSSFILVPDTACDCQRESVNKSDVGYGGNTSGNETRAGAAIELGSQARRG